MTPNLTPRPSTRLPNFQHWSTNDGAIDLHSSTAPETAYQILLEHYSRHPDRVCLILMTPGQPDRPVTYREIIQIAGGYARSYAECGIQPGEVIILILQHGLDLIGAFWGAVLHGAIPSIMPFLTEKLLPERYRKDLAALINITHPGAIVTYPEFVDEVHSAVEAACIADSGNSSVHAVMQCSAVQPVEQPDFDSMGGLSREPQDVVFLQHSSGTTGMQKGVAITHRALISQLKSYAQAIHLADEDVIVSWLPLYHDMGLIAGFMLPILEGVPLVLMSPFAWVRAPYRLLQAVSQYKGTLTWLPNFAYNFFAQKCRESQLEGVDLSSWRAVINCSEPIAWSSFHMFEERFRPYGLRKEALATCYAMAENTFGVTQGGIDEPIHYDEVDKHMLQAQKIACPVSSNHNPSENEREKVQIVSCGRVIPGTQVRVLDSAGQELPERHVGELAVKSNCMLEAYYHRPDATAKAFVDGWYLTGDYGYIADGEIYVIGRKKDLIIVGGRNIFPQDIEAAAGQVPQVHPGRVAAFGVFVESLGTEEVALMAEVDLNDEQRSDPQTCQAIEDAIRLAVNHETSVSLRFVQLVGPHTLVKTSSGKVSRSANRDRFLAARGLEL